jgi:uncharacterized SAM-binding protein YcdF (DUF218 family)
MLSAGFKRIRRIVLRIVAAGALLAVLIAAFLFRSAGRYLVVEHSLERSDAIVVLAGARVERWLEAVDLYHAGWAPRIVLSAGRIEPAEVRLHELGVRYPPEAELVRDAMVQLKVPAAAIDTLRHSLDNTAQEAAAIREASATAGWKRLIVVTSVYHTRRAWFAFSREFRGTSIEVRVRATRYDLAKPDRWWTARTDFRWVTSELQKLLAYRLGLGE